MSKQIIYSNGAPDPIGPYSQAVRSGHLLFVSGQIAIDPANGNLITGDIEKETDQVMRNLSHILKAAGLDFPNVLKCTIFLSNMDDFPLVNGVYGRYFKSDPPARETVQVSRLPKGVNVEISCIAAD